MPRNLTVPREILRWVQGLDLSYSVRDVRRDLQDGFLIAEIFSRYGSLFKPKIQMHSFDHTRNQRRIRNNWEQLQLFFKKNELDTQEGFTKDIWIRIPPRRYIKKTDEEYDEDNLGNDFEQLKHFLIKIYKYLTNKKIVLPEYKGRLHDRANAHTQVYQSEAGSERGTQKLLLGEKGLEEMNQGSKEENKDMDSEDEEAQREKNESLKEKLTMTNTQKSRKITRAQAKPVSNQLKIINQEVEVKKTQVRPIQQEDIILKKSKDQTMHSNQSPQEKTPAQTQQMSSKNMKYQTMDSSMSKPQRPQKRIDNNIYDVVQRYIQEILQVQAGNFESDQLIFDTEFEHVPNYSVIFITRLEKFSDEFITAVFSSFVENQNYKDFMEAIKGDPNELWKFLNFLFNCLRVVNFENPSYQKICEVLRVFGSKLVTGYWQKTKQVFQAHLMANLCMLIKLATFFEHKEKLIEILYYFCPDTSDDRLEMINRYKEKLKDDALFLQSLVVLIRFERIETEDNMMLLKRMRYFAEINLCSTVPNNRSMALALIYQLLRLNPELMTSSIEQNLILVANDSWWENRCLLIMVCAQCIRNIINSDDYQVFVKKTDPTVNKTYSMDNEAKAQTLKDKVEQFARLVIEVTSKNISQRVLKTFFIELIDLLKEQKILMDHFVQLLLVGGEDIKDWVLYNEEKDFKEEFFVFNDRSLRYKVSLDSDQVRDISLEILMSIADFFKEEKVVNISLEYLEIIYYAFQYCDFAELNLEQMDFIFNTIKEFIFLSLKNPNECVVASHILKKMFIHHFKAEVNIKDLDATTLQTSLEILEEEDETCIKNMADLIIYLNDQALDKAKIFLNDLEDDFQKRFGDDYKQNPIGEALAQERKEA